MDNWDEVRTAFQVAKLGTVSGAAEVLGVHHATVIRHIDALEIRLGVKLFQRHSRGYNATEAGLDLMRVAQTTADQFQQLSGRIKGRGSDVSGELVVTSLIENAPLMLEVLAGFQEIYPDIVIRYRADDRVYRLEYGEAHVALRAGLPPSEPDNVAQRIHAQQMGLFASDAYIAKYGLPLRVEDLGEHRFVAHEDPENRAPFYRWLRTHVATDHVVFRSSNLQLLEQALVAGLGIGFLNLRDAQKKDAITRVMPMQQEWTSPLWIVTHVDLHRTAKVQAFVKHIKAFVKEEQVATSKQTVT